jgi:hypothetical protein
MVEALGGVAPSCVASLVETVAADVRLNAHTIESLAAGSPALALALTPAAASTLSRATAGLCLLWRLARRMTSRRAATTEFDASLETIWAASGAFSISHTRPHTNDPVGAMHAVPRRLGRSACHLSARPSLSTPDLDAFQLRF